MMMKLDHDVLRLVGLASFVFGALILDIIAIFIEKGRRTTLLCGAVLAANSLVIMWSLRSGQGYLGTSGGQLGLETLSSTWFIISYGVIFLCLLGIAVWRLFDLSAKSAAEKALLKRAVFDGVAGLLLFVLAAVGLMHVLAPVIGGNLGIFLSFFVAGVLSYPALGRGRAMPIKGFGQWTFSQWCLGYGAVILFTFVVSQVVLRTLGV